MSVYDDDDDDDDDEPSSLLLVSLPSSSPMGVDDDSTPTTLRRRRREWLASPGIIIIFFLLNFVFFSSLAVENQLKHHFCVGMFCWSTIGLICIEYHTLLGLTAHTMTNNMNFNTQQGACYLGMRGKGVRLHSKVIVQRD